MSEVPLSYVFKEEDSFVVIRLDKSKPLLAAESFIHIKGVVFDALAFSHELQRINQRLFSRMASGCMECLTDCSEFPDETSLYG